MTIAFWCVLIAALLPYAAAGIAKAGARFDNRNPRDWLSQQEGYRRRANAAQANSFEAFPFFAAAVIISFIVRKNLELVDTLAVVFIIARIAYLIFYLADQALLRSLAWFVGIGSTIAIFLTAA